MKLEININKKHLIGFIAVLTLGFAMAQLSVPNPGHSITQVAGAARSCEGLSTHIYCNNPLVQGGGSANFALGSGLSYDSMNLEGLPSSSFCKSDGTNCGTNSPVNGSVVGGGNDGWYDGSQCASNCAVWGTATCSSAACGGRVQCPSGSTARVTSLLAGTSANGANYYICVKN